MAASGSRKLVLTLPCAEVSRCFPGFTIGSAESSPSPARWYILYNNVDDVIETARFSLGIQPTEAFTVVVLESVDTDVANQLSFSYAVTKACAFPRCLNFAEVPR